MRSDTVVATIVGLVRLDFFFFFLVESLNRETILEFETPPPSLAAPLFASFFWGRERGGSERFISHGGRGFIPAVRVQL